MYRVRTLFEQRRGKEMTTTYLTPEALKEELCFCKAAWEVHTRIEPADKKSPEYSAWMKYGDKILSAWYNARQAIDFWDGLTPRSRRAVV